MNNELFHGMACLIKLTDGEENFLGDTQGRQGAGHGSRDELISKTDAWCAKIREMVEERSKV